MFDVLLLSIGFMGFVVAALTPYYWFGGAVSLGSFGTYFLLWGNGEWFPIAIFILGVLLIIFEIFIPDFGIAGGGGILLIIWGIYLTYGNLFQTIADLSISFLVAIVLAVLLIKKGYNFENLNRLVLLSNLGSSNGYFSSKDLSDYLGQTGTTTTPLRPSGKVKFEEAEVHVVTNGEHIGTGITVKVTKVEGSKVIVRRVD